MNVAPSEQIVDTGRVMAASAEIIISDNCVALGAQSHGKPHNQSSLSLSVFFELLSNRSMKQIMPFPAVCAIFRNFDVSCSGLNGPNLDKPQPKKNSSHEWKNKAKDVYITRMKIAFCFSSLSWDAL